MPPITARISNFWDPREVLGINPAESHFSCTAIVIPKKKRGQPQEPPRRCLQTFLSNECKDQACQILDTLAHVDVVLVGISEGIKRALVHVAELTACPRLHKEPRLSQAEAVGSKWTDLVGQFIVHERASRRRAEREGLRSLAVSEPRAASHNHSHRNRVPSAPNDMDPRMREAPERAARRPREDVSRPSISSRRHLLTYLSINKVQKYHHSINQENNSRIRFFFKDKTLVEEIFMIRDRSKSTLVNNSPFKILMPQCHVKLSLKKMHLSQICLYEEEILSHKLKWNLRQTRISSWTEIVLNVHTYLNPDLFLMQVSRTDSSLVRCLFRQVEPLEEYVRGLYPIGYQSKPLLIQWMTEKWMALNS
jgi:hypothetical protein